MSAPPYMKLYIADYLADTTHLTCLEHGAYLQLLMALWRAGGKLPRDDAKLARIVKCSDAEWGEMKPVVLEFFKVSGGSLTQKRASAEITKYQRVVDGSKKAGKASASKRTRKDSGLAATDVENTFNENSTNQNQNQNQESPQPPEGGHGLFELKADEPVDPVEEAFGLWNETAAVCGLPRAETLNDGRKRAIRKRLEDGGLEGWRAALANVRTSRFCRGMEPGRKGSDPFKANLDFVCQPSSYQKLREGVYGAGQMTDPLTAPPSPVDAAITETDLWRRRVSAYRDGSRYWNTNDWGPQPGRPSCAVPAAVLNEFGYAVVVELAEARRKA